VGVRGDLLSVGPDCTVRRSIILPFVLCGCEVMGRTKAGSGECSGMGR